MCNIIHSIQKIFESPQAQYSAVSDAKIIYLFSMDQSFPNAPAVCTAVLRYSRLVTVITGLTTSLRSRQNRGRHWNVGVCTGLVYRPDCSVNIGRLCHVLRRCTVTALRPVRTEQVNVWVSPVALPSAPPKQPSAPKDWLSAPKDSRSSAPTKQPSGSKDSRPSAPRQALGSNKTGHQLHQNGPQLQRTIPQL